jgi:hypothetical protein
VQEEKLLIGTEVETAIGTLHISVSFLDGYKCLLLCVYC